MVLNIFLLQHKNKIIPCSLKNFDKIVLNYRLKRSIYMKLVKPTQKFSFNLILSMVEFILHLFIK